MWRHESSLLKRSWPPAWACWDVQSAFSLLLVAESTLCYVPVKMHTLQALRFVYNTHRIHLWAIACRFIIGHHDTSQQTSNRKMSTFHRLTTSCCARNKNMILRRHSPASVHTCPTCIVHWDYYTPGFETVARQCLVCCTATHQNLTVETCWVSGTC